MSEFASAGMRFLARFGRARGIGLISLCFPCAGLTGQTPDGWNSRQILGAELPRGSAWLGAGVWAADQSGPPATLINSLGLGNSLTGGGVSLEGGMNQGAWSFALKALAFRDAQGGSRLTVHQ